MIALIIEWTRKYPLSSPGSTWCPGHRWVWGPGRTTLRRSCWWASARRGPRQTPCSPATRAGTTPAPPQAEMLLQCATQGRVVRPVRYQLTDFPLQDSLPAVDSVFCFFVFFCLTPNALRLVPLKGALNIYLLFIISGSSSPRLSCYWKIMYNRSGEGKLSANTTITTILQLYWVLLM